MNQHQPPIRSLILIGGQSSRMGSAKYLLPIPDSVSQTGRETPLLIHSICTHHIFQVKHGDPLLRTVTLAVRDEAQRNEVKDIIKHYETELPGDLTITYVQDLRADIGPAAGLVAASRLDDFAHWLVTGCDYPLMTKAALEQLATQHQSNRKAVTCFINSDGWNEPLLALWTPRALQRLLELVEERDVVGPNQVLQEFAQEAQSGVSTDRDYTCGVMKVEPSVQGWTTSVNTKEEWAEVQAFLRDGFPQSNP